MRKKILNNLSRMSSNLIATVACASIVSCSLMPANEFDPGLVDPDCNNPFVGVWLSTSAKTDTTEVHIQFDNKGGGIEFETYGDSIIDVKNFRYSYNAYDIIIEASSSMYGGRYTFEFNGIDNDTLVFDSHYKFVKWIVSPVE